MKKILTIFLFIQFLSESKAQIVFCPPGAEWHYFFYWAGYNPGSRNEAIKYTGDSIIGNDTLKVLAHTRFYLQCSNLISKTLLKQRGDTIYFKNSRTQGSWQILYNFAALTGQNWTTTILLGNNSPATFTFQVVGVQQVIQNNFNLKNLLVTVNNNYNSSTANLHITERTGSSGFLFHYMNFMYGWCDADYFGERLCYQDNAFGLKQYSSKPCDFQNLTGLEDSYSIKTKITLFPNPTQNLVKLKMEGKAGELFTVSIRDVSEREISVFQITGEKEFEVNTSNYQTGIYFVTVTNSRGKGVATEKLIIAR